MDTEDATNPAADEDLRVESEEGVADEAEAQGDDQSGDETEESEQDQPEDDAEEVELDGQKYRLPKALKPALMMQADYTRKTQELSEQRKAWEQESTQQAESFKALRAEHVRVATLETQVQAYEQYDWNTAYQQAAQSEDPVGDQARLNAAYMQYQNLRNTLGDAKSTLATKEQEQALETQRKTAKQIEDGLEVLKRDIPGWSKDLASKLLEFGTAQGFDQRQLASETDPRIIKLLHLAYQGQQTAKQRTAAQNIQKQQQVAPAVRPKGNFAPAGLHDKLPAEEWARRRNAELAKRRSR